MACFHPLRYWPLGEDSFSGKKIGKVTAYEVNSLVKDSFNSPWQPCELSSPGPFFYRSMVADDSIVIGCGQCMGCRMARSREWADRCMLELKYASCAWFVTLTYDDEHIPMSAYADPDTGEVVGRCNTLRRKDVQDFLKRVRKAFPDVCIRFFGCGEYGPQTIRPHYHLIIYNLPLDDLVPVPGAEIPGTQYYWSLRLQKLWSIYHRGNPSYGSITPLAFELGPPFMESEWNGREYCWYEPIGQIMVAEVNWTTCAYVARYCTKKLTGKLGDVYQKFNMTPPFSMMSTNPGIARKYYDDHSMEIYRYKYINLATDKGGRKIRPPHYFDKLYDLDQPEHMAEIKAQRQKLAQAMSDNKLRNTTNDYMEMLAVEERNFESRIRCLERKL